MILLHVIYEFMMKSRDMQVLLPSVRSLIHNTISIVLSLHCAYSKELPQAGAQENGFKNAMD